jgi:hypothetical protein
MREGLRRALWFIGLWAAGVAAVGVVALLIRTCFTEKAVGSRGPQPPIYVMRNSTWPKTRLSLAGSPLPALNGRAQQRLRRDARPVGALATDQFVLDKCDAQPALCGRAGQCSPGEPPPKTMTS